MNCSESKGHILKDDKCGLIWKYGSEWSEWNGVTTSVTDTTYKQTLWRDFSSRKGEPVPVEFCNKVSDETNSKLTMHWVWVDIRKTRDDAKSHCESLGGHLFDEVTYSERQLTSTKLGDKILFTAIEKTDGR